MKPGCQWILLMVAGWLAVGCVNYKHGPEFDPRQPAPITNELAVTNRIDSALLEAPTNEFRLGPGDEVEIELIGSSEPPTQALVGPDGRIYFSLLPGLNVWGLTLREARDRLEHDLGQYVKYPRIAVTLREVRSRRVWVLGRVDTPGIYSLNEPTTLLEAIGRAGGLAMSGFTGTTEELADLNHSFVMRGGKFLPVDFRKLIYNGDMSQNIYLQPNDFVFLPSAAESEVYVLGSVALPRSVVFKDQVTLSSALATAGGWLPTGHPQEVVIVRGSLAEPHYAVVNLIDILKGKTADVRLQPRDIVYVPDHPLGLLRETGYLILQTFVRTVAANEGLAAGGTVQKVGVNINVGP